MNLIAYIRRQLEARERAKALRTARGAAVRPRPISDSRVERRIVAANVYVEAAEQFIARYGEQPGACLRHHMEEWRRLAYTLRMFAGDGPETATWRALADRVEAMSFLAEESWARELAEKALREDSGG